jgi:hypothetical protein
MSQEPGDTRMRMRLNLVVVACVCFGPVAGPAGAADPRRPPPPGYTAAGPPVPLDPDQNPLPRTVAPAPGAVLPQHPLARSAPAAPPVQPQGRPRSLTSIREGRAPDGRRCRQFSEPVIVAGRQEFRYGVACQKPNGDWEIIPD